MAGQAKCDLLINLCLNVFNLCSNGIHNDMKVLVGGKKLVNERGTGVGGVGDRNFMKILVVPCHK